MMEKKLCIIMPLTLVGNKNECISDTQNDIEKPQKHCAEQKEPDTKKHILCDSIYMTSSTGKTNLQCQKSDQWLPGLRSGEV